MKPTMKTQDTLQQKKVSIFVKHAELEAKNTSILATGVAILTIAQMNVVGSTGIMSIVTNATEVMYIHDVGLIHHVVKHTG
jgi:hypothetical protein